MNTAKIADDRKKFLDALVAQIDTETAHERDYCTQNADYAEPLFYSDWKIYLDRLDADTLALVEQFKALVGKTWRQDLKDLCDVVSTGVFMSDTEISSLPVGEPECQHSGEVTTVLETLTPEEVAYVRARTNEYLDGATSYINCNYERWVLELNPELLAERVAELTEQNA